MTYHDKTVNAAKGKWRGILLTLGLPESCLRDRHGPCPVCGGEDRFRWDNKDGRGTFICSQHGAGDGIKLAMEYTGKCFSDVASEIDAMVGNVKPDAPRREMTDASRRDILRDVYRATRRVEEGDLVHRYLASRGVEDLIYPDALRFAPKLTDGDGGIRPCMVAMIHAEGHDKPVSMHRTFLRSDGLGKAEMASPRKLMPGALPDGSCVRLSDYTPGGALGIAEGIETAMAASVLFGVPTWAAIASKIMAKWTPPEGCDEVVIFGDNDPKFGGQEAAYTLAHKLAVKGLEVTVKLPAVSGEDWNDVLMKGATA